MDGKACVGTGAALASSVGGCPFPCTKGGALLGSAGVLLAGGACVDLGSTSKPVIRPGLCWSNVNTSLTRDLLKRAIPGAKLSCTRSLVLS